MIPCLLVHQHPEMLETFKNQDRDDSLSVKNGFAEYYGKAAVLMRADNCDSNGTSDLTELQKRILGRLESGPAALGELLKTSPTEYAFKRDIEKLIRKGQVILSGITPTDAAHVLGFYDEWSADGSKTGLSLYFKSIFGRKPDNWELEDFAGKIFNEAVVQSARCIFSAGLSEYADRSFK